MAAGPLRPYDPPPPPRPAPPAMSALYKLYRLALRVPAGRRTARLARRLADNFEGLNNRESDLNGEDRLVRERLPGCRVAIDGGACVGDWAAGALAAEPALELHCFEPIGDSFRRLRDRDLPGNVVRNHAGLSDAPGTATFHTFPGNRYANSLYRRAGANEKLGEQSVTEEAPLVTLDGYCAERGIDRVDFLKLDVEGHELAVLRGSAGLLAGRRIGAVQFEYGTANAASRALLKDLFDLLTGHGYRLSKVYPKRLEPVPRYDLRLENFQYANYLAEPAADGPAGTTAAPKGAARAGGAA